MALTHSPSIVTDGLILYLDAANKRSYSGTGNSLLDLSGNRRNATINGSPSFLDNCGFLITGDSTYISLSNSGLIPRTNDFTYSSWILFNSVDNYDTIFENGSWTDTLLFRYETNKFLIYAEGAYRGEFNWLAAINTWHNIVLIRSNNVVSCYINNNLIGTPFTMNLDISLDNTNLWLMRSQHEGNQFTNGIFSAFKIYNRALTAQEISRNFNALYSRYSNLPLGTFSNPFSSPLQAQNNNYPDGNYYFKSGSMTLPVLLEYKNNYYENKSWVCVFRSPYRATATTNHIDKNIPMAGFLVQRDALDIRAAVYWSSSITYNSSSSGSGNNTANSGYSPRRVILGLGGGHGIYNTNQNACSWSDGAGAIGAGWDGSTCGSFPNDLVWGTGQSGTPNYINRSGTWSHWIYWE